MADDADQGQREARTRAETPENAADGGKPAVNFGLADALERFTEAQQGDDLDLMTLLDQSIERSQRDTLTLMAEPVASARRGPGRPLGSKMRRNNDVFDYLEGMGYTPPEVVLSKIATIDPRHMAVMMRRHKHFGAALDKVIKAAAELLPYKLAKRTPDVAAPPEEKTPLLIMHRLPVSSAPTGGALGVGLVKREPVMNNDGE